MTRSDQRSIRVLAIEPTSRGFGYALLELPDDVLVRWGLHQVRHAEMSRRALTKLAGVIHQYAPTVVVVEDTRHPRCRRRGKGRALIEAIVDLAQTMNVAIGRVLGVKVREHYAELGAQNKDAVAKLIVERFPELRPVLPPPRKLWMPKDERMTIFESVAFATFFAITDGNVRR